MQWKRDHHSQECQAIPVLSRRLNGPCIVRGIYTLFYSQIMGSQCCQKDQLIPVLSEGLHKKCCPQIEEIPVLSKGSNNPSVARGII